VSLRLSLKFAFLNVLDFCFRFWSLVRVKIKESNKKGWADHKNQISLSGYSCHTTVMTWGCFGNSS